MKLVHWVLLTYFLLAFSAVGIALYARYLYPPVCRAGGDVKREVHEVYPLRSE